MLPPTDSAPPCTPSAPFFSDPPAVAVSYHLAALAPHYSRGVFFQRRLLVPAAWVHAIFGPGAVGAVGLLRQGPHSTVVCHRAARVWWRRRPWIACHAAVAAVGPAVLARSGGGGFSVPSLPLSFLSRHSIARGVHSGGFIPPGQCFHSVGVDALRRLDSPSHSLAVPPRGVPPLRRHFCYLRLPPLWRVCPPLCRPRGPPLLLPLHRSRLPGFPACRRTSP